MNAMIANVWSANSAADVQKATMLPRFDVRARQDVWHDKDDINGRYEEGVIELVMTYNLYNGGSDRAERRRLLYKANQAADMRTQTCRDVRQEVSIAYNEMRATDEQLIFLDRHQTSIDKARDGLPASVRHRPAHPARHARHRKRVLHVAASLRERQAAERHLLRACAGRHRRAVSALELGNDLHPMEKPSTDEETPDMEPCVRPNPTWRR